MKKILLCAIAFVGCSGSESTDVLVKGPIKESEDGGIVENADREQAQEYFNSLAKVQTTEEEKTLLSEFGRWLNSKGYKILVENKDDKHRLSCPHMPPVTPWIDYSFRDIKNLQLLPQ